MIKLLRCIFFISVLPVVYLQAQNLAPNPDFEFYTSCPVGFNPGNPLNCPPWIAGTWGTSDYLHSCSNPSDVGVPANSPGWQYARTGEGYVGLLLKASNPFDYREYLTGPLNSTLVGGKKYYVSFYVSLANTRCGIQQIGAYFSAAPPPNPFGVALPLTQFVPQIETNGPFLNDTLNWMHIEGCFLAAGGEAYVTIGNFHTNADTPLDPMCTSLFTGTYYYFEDVFIDEVQPGAIDVDLGGPVSECYSYEIDPGLSGVNYYWSTGSTDPTITVTTSGTYYLSVYDACAAGVDSIEVLITNSPPIELDPDEITICQGESISYALDPNLGDYSWSDGTNSPDNTFSTTGIYGVTLDDGCDITSATFDLTVLDPPSPFSLGPDTFLCVGSEIEFYFDPDLGDFLWQNNTNANSLIAIHAGYYAVTISNMCGEESSEVVISEEIPSFVNLGIDADTLCNGDSLNFSLNPTLGTYLWQDGSTDPDYHITNSGIYSVTMTDMCGPSADTVDVLALSTPAFTLGDTLLPCPGDTLTLAVVGISGKYKWQDGSTNDSLIVTTSGVYALTVDNACGVHSDDVVIEYEDVLAPANLGPDFSLCPGEQAILSTGNTNANYVWQDQSTADSLLITTGGTYHVTVSNSCSTYTDTIIVTVENEPPVITLPDQITLCQGAVEILDPGVSGVTYTWNNGTQNPTLSISSPGNYSLTVSNACGGDVDTVVVLDGGPLPSVLLGPDTSICPGESIVVNPSFTNVNSWIWADGSTSSTLIVTDSGTIEVIVSNACGLAHDTIDISLLDATPVLDLGVDTSFCNGSSVTLSILFSNVNIQWSDGSSNSSLLIDDPGIYYATVSNACGISTDTVVVDTLPAIPVLDLGPDLPLCPGEEITITPGILNVDYLWQDGSTNSFYLADHSQTIMLTISNECGSSSDALVIYTSTNGPDVDLGPDILVCEGEVVTIMSNISGVDYEWQDGSTGSSFVTSASGTFHVQVSNACGTDNDTIEVDIHGMAPMPLLGVDTLLCEGNTLTLTSEADSETTTLWQNGSTLPDFLVTTAGIYILTQANRCGTNADSIIVSFQLLPAAFDLGADTILCPGENLLLTAPVTTDEIEWQDGSSSNTFLAVQAGNYSLTLRNKCGTKSDDLTLTYDNQLIVFPPEDAFELCPGDAMQLDVTQIFNASYHWNTNSILPVISVTSPGIYTVTVNTECQEASNEIIISVKSDCASNNDFFIPNVMTPNGDKINDLFTVSSNQDIEILSINGSIFDRWGNVVFSSTEIPFVWNGKFGNKEVMPGVYVYSIIIHYKVDGQEIQERFTGDVTVMK